jgi:hypothetical protein
MGRLDVFVRKYDAAGNVQWTRQFGSAESDLSYGISADRFGDVYVSGYTQGTLGTGNNNAFVTKYNASGVLQWIRTLGASGSGSQGVSADGLGNVYTAGELTDNSGVENPFVAKYVDGIPGDYNQDGVVDAADYTLWRDSFAQVVAPCSGADGDCNGFINASDYQIWKDHFGDALSSGAGAQSIGGQATRAPEPTSLALWSLGATAAMLIRRRLIREA